MGGVALVAHEVVAGLSWQEAFILGVVVAPTDPLAATSIAGRFGVPRRVVVVIEGEGLVNDATALVLYRTAVAAAVGSGFSIWDAGLRLAVGAVGGIAIGLGVGLVVREVRRRIDHPQAEIGLALLTATSLTCRREALDVLAVLAAVTAGIFVGWHAPALTTPALRLQGAAFWDVLTFILNSVLFGKLVGLQLLHVVAALEEQASGEVAAAAVAVSLTVVLRPDPVGVPVHARAGFVRSTGAATPAWRSVTIVAWAGMRGAVSLAAALAIPLEVANRDPLIFLTFVVILVTLAASSRSRR